MMVGVSHDRIAPMLHRCGLPIHARASPPIIKMVSSCIRSEQSECVDRACTSPHPRHRHRRVSAGPSKYSKPLREVIMNACGHSMSLGLVLFAHPLNGVRRSLARGRRRAIPTRPFATALMSAALFWTAQPALAQWTQYGDKLVGNDAVGPAPVNQGSHVAISGDGTTAIIGGPFDNSGMGAAWVFVRRPPTSRPLWFQQGPKLVGSSIGMPNQGTVALSADGNTAIVGGAGDNDEVGAAWIFTRGSGGWTQQARLVGNDVVGPAGQGWSVALSGDGNTALMGGPHDNNSAGAAWVFTRSGSTWTQQGIKLVGTGAVGPNVWQGWTVALSADGNTAMVGGPGDSNEYGAAWIFTRSGGFWTQQGNKLVPSDGVGSPFFTGTALSADGNTAIAGGPGNNSNEGAAWVFTRSGGAWTQQAKLVGNGAMGAAEQSAGALSADGNTAILGGGADNGGVGAAWVFTRTGGVWTQQGPKLVGTGAVGLANQGSVALSGDGKTAIIGGYNDNSGAGAAWIFVQTLSVKLNSAGTHDFDHDSMGDIAWRDTGGTVAAWLMSGQNIKQAGSFGVAPMSWQIVGQRDFNNDGTYDWLWRDGSTGAVAIWLLNGLSILQTGGLGAVPSNWQVVGTSDFNYDGRGDILWRDNSTGAVAIWLMDGLSVLQSGGLGTVPLNWNVAATDGEGNIFWRDSNSGTLAGWHVYGFEILQSASLGAVPPNWVIAGVGDFDASSSTDILWRDNNTGTVAIWLLTGLSVFQVGSLGVVPSNWSIAETGDFNKDGRSDILWRDTSTGDTAIWFMNGLQILVALGVGNVPLTWTIQGMNAD
jgi:hypothetical protein